ncbi:Catalyzes methyl transfer from S-methylmethionine (SMM) to adenosyl-L-homocysteine (AdoMet) [Nowakowskiella sp. JEL0078]|nr:Catalyzes methyl transfer from S-methylmethionine (SMM) to adenosyl-L-homocysteine (AdoMet) [Nowakowskiella sp. JEL0078]
MTFKNPFSTFDRVVILDGGLATALEEYYKKTFQNNLWSASSILFADPQAIKNVHLDYLKAGADVILTSTYQCHLPGFVECGFSEEEGKILMRKGVHLAQEALKEFIESTAFKVSQRRKPLIALSLGSYGAILSNGAEFSGDFGSVTDKDLYTFHFDRLKILADAPAVDILAFETIPSLQEARVIAKLLSEHHDMFPSVPAWISFSCRDKHSIGHGELFVDCVEEILKLSKRVVAIGINCTNPEFVQDLISGAVEVVKSYERDISFLCYPNNGEYWIAESRSWGSSQHDLEGRFLHLAEQWASAGVKAIGGCCRTSPSYIYRLYKSQFSN